MMLANPRLWLVQIKIPIWHTKPNIYRCIGQLLFNSPHSSLHVEK